MGIYQVLFKVLVGYKLGTVRLSPYFLSTSIHCGRFAG